MELHDDDLKKFEAYGAPPLPQARVEGYVDHDNARIWYAVYGSGPAVILLHGGLGHSGNWGYQVPMLINSGRRIVLIDSRGHGRSTRDSRHYTYELMAADVLAVMDTLRLEKAPLVGWSDGACIALILAMKVPARIAGVFFFGCNMDPGGTREIEWPNPVIDRCLARHANDYHQLSTTPDHFEGFAEAVGQMQRTQPDYSANDLTTIDCPVVIVQSEHDEFIKADHAQYLAQSIPGADLIVLDGVSHFAPLQRPELFNKVVEAFLEIVSY
ncbi:alpha/beta hydrolase [Spirosoma aureum]|uniref:Alpha/beta hydrolase n=2 Tax=Spirosoma aureum TaxID=2692134 RepID=A0A6G9AZQ7_9BACT|nr:alpha/beta hydrolase [Spirosoma aureum]